MTVASPFSLLPPPAPAPPMTVSWALPGCFCSSGAVAPPLGAGELTALVDDAGPLTQPSSTLPSIPGISLFETLKKNFSAVLRSLNVICADVGVLWMPENSPMP